MEKHRKAADKLKKKADNTQQYIDFVLVSGNTKVATVALLIKKKFFFLNWIQTKWSNKYNNIDWKFLP